MNKEFLKDLDNETIISLIEAYDEYIQDANDENKYRYGWNPVCIEEFYNNDFELYKTTNEDNDIEDLSDDDLLKEYGDVIRELQNRGYNAKMYLLDKLSKSYIYALYYGEEQIDQTSIDDKDIQLAWKIMVEDENRNPKELTIKLIDEVQE